MLGRTVEVSGHWDAAGFFVGTEIEELPWSRRPKLRGALEHVQADPASPSLGTVLLYGKTIAVNAATELSDSSGEALSLRVFGLAIVPDTDAVLVTQGGPLHRIGEATNMTLFMQEGLAAVQELLKDRYRERDAKVRGNKELADRLEDEILNRARPRERFV